jgi:hypothetical protein
MPLFEKNTVLVSGLVATVHIVLQDHDASGERTDKVFSMAREMQGQIRRQVEEEVLATLGDNFEVVGLNISPGSAHIWIHLAAVGAIYMGLSRYKSLVESVNLLTSQLTGVVRRILEPFQMDDENLIIRSNWTPGPAIMTASQSLASQNRLDSCSFLLMYLVLSHAALLALFFWLVIRHMK